MNKLKAILALVIVSSIAAVVSSTARAGQSEERGHAVLQIGSNKIEVDHGRPALQGRKPEAMIQPGQVWRMGANDPTTLSTQGSLKFGDKVVPAGHYTLQAKFVAPQKWHLLIESDGGTIVAEVPFVLQKVDKAAELLTILLEKKGAGGRLVLQWGTLALATEFQPVG